MKRIILALGTAAIAIGFWIALPSDEPQRHLFPDGTRINRCR